VGGRARTLTGAEGRAVGEEESKGGGGKAERIQGPSRVYLAWVVW
jgi:hypothetical protein